MSVTRSLLRLRAARTHSRDSTEVRPFTVTIPDSELDDLRGPGLLEAGQEAFTQGMQVAAVSGAAMALTTALLAAAFLRRARTGSPPD